MHLSFLNSLACPHTGEPLRMAHVERRQDDIILEGVLAAGERTYPVRNGVPRFVDDSGYCDSFGYEWNKWRRVQFESENVGSPMEGHTLRMFERIVGPDVADLTGKTVLDVGCGPGRFLDIIRRKGGKAIGIDYSSAVEAAAANFRDDSEVLICQGDALRLPLRAQSVDGAYSIGVLHHTPDPEGGLAEMRRVARPGAWVAVSVYGKGGYYDSLRVRAWRVLFHGLRPMLGLYPPLVYSYLAAYGAYPLTYIPGLGHLLRAVLPLVRLPDARWRVLDTFDSVTPTHQSAHESYEVFQWFKRAGLAAIEPADWGFASYHGVIPRKAA